MGKARLVLANPQSYNTDLCCKYFYCWDVLNDSAAEVKQIVMISIREREGFYVIIFLSCGFQMKLDDKDRHIDIGI